MVGAWVRLLVNSAVVAAVAVAAQLGAGEALGIINWDDAHDPRAWRTLLTWLAFSYTVAVLAGAMVGRIAVRSREGIGARLTASLVAAAGAAAGIGLAWLPAQSLQPPINVDPGLVVSLTAGAGVVAGLVLALLALAARPIGHGLQAMAAWLWLLAIAAAAVGLASHTAFPPPQLGVPEAPSVLAGSPWTGPRVMIVAAVVISVVASGLARWRGSGRVGAALAGFGGPALAAAAYLIAGPGGDTSISEPYLTAVLATAAGLVASVLVAMPGRRSAPPPRQPAPVTEGPLQGDVIEAVRTPTSPVSAQGRARPAWAQGSGPFAQAYSAASSTREPVTVAARGTGWDGDTLTGTASSSSGRHAHQEAAGGGLYRSTSAGEGDEGTPQPWLPDLRPTGRHASID